MTIKNNLYFNDEIDFEDIYLDLRAYGIEDIDFNEEDSLKAL